MIKYEDAVDVKIVGITGPLIRHPDTNELLTPEQFLVYIARVSNPSNQTNTLTTQKLIKYLLEHKHFSPFEMINVVFEVFTTRDIGRQILRHKSSPFQEFCVDGDTQITTLEGGKQKLIPIKTLFSTQKNNNYKIKVYNRNTKSFISSDLVEVFDTGIKPVYKLTLDNGKTITGAEYHKILTLNGYKEIKNLDIDTDFVAVNGILNKTAKYIKIRSIEYIGDRQTYDLEVDHEEHNYIGNGIITHNSQRYADPTKDLMFVLREARLQDTKNRQNSIVIDDEALQKEWYRRQMNQIELAIENYNWAIANNIAKEQARCVLPEGNTTTRMYMNSYLRSLLHYIDVRSDPSTQKEHRIIADKIKIALSEHFTFIGNTYKIA